MNRGANWVAKTVNGSKPDNSDTVETEIAGAPSEGGAGAAGAQQLDPELVKKIAAVRSQVRESFGKIVMAMMMLPRYRRQTLDDLQHLVLEPLMRDRIAIAYPGEAEQGQLSDIAGLAIWANVSEEVDAAIREQIKAGVFPLRLKAEEWTSGPINWLLDVIAPDQRTTARVIANFRQVVKEGSLRLHPLVTRLVDEETLKKMGAERMPARSEA
jgi:hemolysin-activating ACP:hemolysin acyltransferase